MNAALIAAGERVTPAWQSTECGYDISRGQTKRATAVEVDREQL
jgi:hypothetical protein